MVICDAQKHGGLGMEEKIITEKTKLLKEDGTLNVVGYSKTPLVEYNSEFIKKRSRMKEWDYYYIADSRFGLCLTISNLSYATAISASVIEFNVRKQVNKTSVAMFPKNKPVLAESSSVGVSMARTKDADFKFETRDGKRHLVGIYKNYYPENGSNRDLEFDIELYNEPEESMVKVTPFNKKHQFYYNQKINGMTASGRFTYKGRNYVFDARDTLATLDWGRGVLPYSSLWYWASMQAKTRDGNIIGFNLGRAFGDNSDATENMIFVNGKAHKVGDIRINIRRDNRKHDYMGTWTFYSDDGRIELMFEPILDRYAPFNALVIAFLPHQVFGKYSGKLILDDGNVIEIDNVPGFAERVVNRW